MLIHNILQPQGKIGGGYLPGYLIGESHSSLGGFQNISSHLGPDRLDHLL
jgi:hypothetical protein